MKKILIITMIILIATIIPVSAEVYPDYNMKWSFQIFNSPDARQVAINTAQSQNELIEEETETDQIDQFTDSLDRRLSSVAQREIVDIIMGESDVPYGEFEAGNLWISVAEDPQTGEVMVEITDVVSGDSTVITYSQDDF
ncbi:MAG: curli assembly protein CsgF [bacterium]